MDETIDYSVSEEGLTMDDLQAKMSVGEFKYYKGDNSILVVNASENALQGLYMNNGNVIEGSYMEYDDRIEIKGSTQVYVFNKSGNDVMYNGVKLTLQI